MSTRKGSTELIEDGHLLARELAGLRVLSESVKSQALQLAELLVIGFDAETPLPANFEIKRVGPSLRLVVGDIVFTDEGLSPTHVIALAEHLRQGWIDDVLRLVESAREQLSIGDVTYRSVLEGLSRGVSSLQETPAT